MLWFTIQWGIQPHTAHVSAVQLKMAGQAWIAQVWRKPVAILHRFIPSKFLLLQWLFNLAQWINFCLMSTEVLTIQVHFVLTIKRILQIKKKVHADLRVSTRLCTTGTFLNFYCGYSTVVAMPVRYVSLFENVPFEDPSNTWDNP